MSVKDAAIAPEFASASLAQQARQLGDIRRYAPSFIRGQHVRNMRVIRIVARVDVSERLATSINHL